MAALQMDVFTGQEWPTDPNWNSSIEQDSEQEWPATGIFDLDPLFVWPPTGSTVQNSVFMLGLQNLMSTGDLAICNASTSTSSSAAESDSAQAILQSYSTYVATAAEQMHLVEQNVHGRRPSKASTVNTGLELKHPTPSDWAILRSKIIEKYRKGTARMVLKELHKEGYSVTDKMLRTRLRAWGVQKNKKGLVPRQGISGPTDAMVAESAPSLERPLSTSTEDHLPLQFLSSMDHYFESATGTGLGHESTQRSWVISNLFVNLASAIDLAASHHRNSAWKFLRQAGSDLLQCDWQQIDPRHMLKIFGQIADWRYSSSSSEREILRTILGFVSTTAGKQHPVCLVMDLTIRGKLNDDVFRKGLLVAQARGEAYDMDEETSQSWHRILQEIEFELYWDGGDWAACLESIHSWTPLDRRGEITQLMQLVRVNLKLREQEEVTELCEAAYDTIPSGEDHFYYATCFVLYHIQALLGQGRCKDAVKICLEKLSILDTLAPADGIFEYILVLQYLRLLFIDERTNHDVGNADLDKLIEKLDAMSIDK